MSEIFITIFGISSNEEEARVERELSDVFASPAKPHETLSGISEAVGFIVTLAKVDIAGAATRFRAFLRKHIGQVTNWS